MKTSLNITEISKADKKPISEYLAEHWDSQIMVSRSKIHNIPDLPGFICKNKTGIIGLITYHIENNECEIVTLDSDMPDKGLGTSLIQRVIDTAKTRKCKRVWLLTTNDNTRAIRFYQKRGFEWIGFYRNAIEESRKLKQRIPEVGKDGIPIKHEIEFEYQLNLSK